MNKNKMRQVKTCLDYLCDRLDIGQLSVMSNGSLRIQGKPNRGGCITGYRFANRWPGAKAGLFRMNAISRKERARQLEGMKAKGNHYQPMLFSKDICRLRAEEAAKDVPMVDGIKRIPASK